MKIIFIYGAPATGKLTVARELAKFLNYKLHHNHMAIDLALALFDFDNPNFLILCQRINLDVFKIASDGGLPGLIFTFTYGGSPDDSFIAEVISRFGDDVCFVHLSCDLDELKRRVVSESRSEFKKVRDVNVLLNVLQFIDYAKDIAHSQHISLDTTSLEPQVVARRIVESFR